MSEQSKIPKAEPIAKESVEAPQQESQTPPSSSDVKNQYSVIEPINHDGQAYQPKDPIFLIKKQAEPLLAMKVIEE